MKILFIGSILLLSLIPSFAFNSSRTPVDRPQIVGVAQIAFQVSDLTKARRFYGSILGYEEVFPVSDPNSNKEGLCFKVNDRQFIEIYPGLPPEQDERLLRLAFETGDADGLRRYLGEKGAQTPASVERGKDLNLHLTFKDPDRHWIDFVEYTAASPHTKSRGKKLSEARVSERILHAGLTIADVPASDKLYKDILGFSEIWRGGANENTLSWINMKVPDGTDYIEYMLVSGPVDRQRLGTLHHIALVVPDIQKALEIVRARSSETERRKMQSPRVGRNNRWQLNLFDPDGSRVELMEPHPMR